MISWAAETSQLKEWHEWCTKILYSQKSEHLVEKVLGSSAEMKPEPSWKGRYWYLGLGTLSRLRAITTTPILVVPPGFRQTRYPSWYCGNILPAFLGASYCVVVGHGWESTGTHPDGLGMRYYMCIELLASPSTSGSMPQWAHGCLGSTRRSRSCLWTLGSWYSFFL